MYYRLYDKQTGTYRATGYNATSEEDLVEQFKSYVSVDQDEEEMKLLSKWSTEEVLLYIEAYELEIEQSEIPFPEEEEPGYELF